MIRIIILILMSCLLPLEMAGNRLPHEEVCEAAKDTILLDFAANASTGLYWYAEIQEGDSVSIDSALGEYVSDPNPDFCDGIGGTVYYTFRAVRPGSTVIGFTYGRDTHAEPCLSKLMRFCVDDDMMIRVYDITEFHS